MPQTVHAGTLEGRVWFWLPRSSESSVKGRRQARPRSGLRATGTAGGVMATAELLPKERLWGAVFFYLALGTACLSALALTLQAQPLFPFQLDSLPWSNAWLIMTVGDYYGSALCLCGFIVATEPAGCAARQPAKRGARHDKH